MKRRVQLKSCQGEEEEDDEVGVSSRRNSLRKRKRVSYGPDVDEDEDGKEEEEEEEEDRADDEVKDAELLDVTCGNKMGLLDTVKLSRGEEKLTTHPVFM